MDVYMRFRKFIKIIDLSFKLLHYDFYDLSSAYYTQNKLITNIHDFVLLFTFSFFNFFPLFGFLIDIYICCYPLKCQ